MARVFLLFSTLAPPALSAGLGSRHFQSLEKLAQCVARILRQGQRSAEKSLERFGITRCELDNRGPLRAEERVLERAARLPPVVVIASPTRERPRNEPGQD
jgi:hypothetical protein